MEINAATAPSPAQSARPSPFELETHLCKDFTTTEKAYNFTSNYHQLEKLEAAKAA